MKRLETELPGLGQQHRKLLLDAAAIAAYHAEVGCPVVRVLLCDDAPQFNWLTQQMMQCWVHEGRHYKKLLPVVDLHRQQVQDFLKRFWAYYDQLLAYQKDPSPAEHERLVAEFDTLFGQSTGYAALDQRIAKTKIKKDTLLLVLAHPELPLHNNAAELAVRQRVRKRDVSFGPRTQAGVRAGIRLLAGGNHQKVGGQFLPLYSGSHFRNQPHPPLADLVSKAAKDLNLGWSFSCDIIMR